MRISLHVPLRRPWPVTAAAAGRTYRYRRKAMLPDWPTPIYSRWLPDGRFEISIAGCAPAVVSPGLYYSRTDYQRWQILRLLHVYGKWFASSYGRQLPIETGRFVEAGEEFVFEDEGDPYTFARLRVPRRIVVSGEDDRRRESRPQHLYGNVSTASALRIGVLCAGCSRLLPVLPSAADLRVPHT